MKLQKVLASSLLCAVCCLSFKTQKISADNADKETVKLQLHSISTDNLNDNITLKKIHVSYIDSKFDESEFSLVTEEDTKLPEDMKYNMFYVTEDIELKNSIDESSETVTIIPKGTLIEVELSGDAFSKVNFEDKKGIIKADVLTKTEVEKDEDKSENKDDSKKEKTEKVNEESQQETKKEKATEQPQQESNEEQATEQPQQESKKEQATEQPQQESNEEQAAEQPQQESKKEQATEQPQQEREKVTLYATDVLNVRENPSTNSNRLGSLNKADEVTGFDEGDWISFDFNGQKAYVMKAYLSKEKPVIEVPKKQDNVKEIKQDNVKEIKQDNANIPTDSNKIETVVNAALAQVGKAYVWASSNPNVGFDCSGLTYYAFNQVGITLNRVAADQYANGTPISRENLMRGDLVFFSYGGGIGHVGLYIGNGKFVHASTYSTGVIVSDLSGYYLNVYAGAVRVIK